VRWSVIADRRSPPKAADRVGRQLLAASPAVICLSPPGAALDLLLRNLERGATLAGIGPWTSLALLEITRPRSLSRAPVVATGG
jgi:hypothetical protein